MIDIDIYHTQEDRPAYNRWPVLAYRSLHRCGHCHPPSIFEGSRGDRALQAYGGGPSNEHNYTTGLLHYYYLTGDPSAREAVLGLADWVINMDDGSHRLLGRFDRRPTGFCSSTASRDYHGPGRGAGNSINALLDAYVLTKAEHTTSPKAEELIRRCIHPKDVIAQRHLDDVEHRWSYMVFLQVLGKYLDIKVEAGDTRLHVWLRQGEFAALCGVDARA